MAAILDNIPGKKKKTINKYVALLSQIERLSKVVDDMRQNRIDLRVDYAKSQTECCCCVPCLSNIEMQDMVEGTILVHQQVVSDYRREAQCMDDYAQSLDNQDNPDDESFLQRWDSVKNMMDELGKRNAMRAELSDKSIQDIKRARDRKKGELAALQARYRIELGYIETLRREYEAIQDLWWWPTYTLLKEMIRAATAQTELHV